VRHFHSSGLLSSLAGAVAGILMIYRYERISHLAAGLWYGIAAGLCRIFVYAARCRFPLDSNGQPY
jgi:hypothetical protein